MVVAVGLVEVKGGTRGRRAAAAAAVVVVGGGGGGERRTQLFIDFG